MKCSARWHVHVLGETGHKTERYQSVQNCTGGIEILPNGNLRCCPVGIIQCLTSQSTLKAMSLVEVAM